MSRRRPKFHVGTWCVYIGAGQDNGARCRVAEVRERSKWRAPAMPEYAVSLSEETRVVPETDLVEAPPPTGNGTGSAKPLLPAKETRVITTRPSAKPSSLPKRPFVLPLEDESGQPIQYVFKTFRY